MTWSIDCGVGIPEFQTSNKAEFTLLGQTLNAVVFQLEGLDMGQTDTGFIYQGVLFRLTVSP